MDTIYAFGPFRLETSAEILFRDAAALPVGRRAVGVLRALLEHPGVPVSKDALMQAAWPGLAVEENNLTVQIAALRRELAAEPGGESWIETLPRRGYRFIGPVRRLDDPAISILVRPAAPPAPDKPSIAVMPFRNMSGDPEQEYFSDGMVEEITTALSRIRWLFVIARNSSFAYKGKAVDVKQVAHELGVRYVLEGSVRKVAERVRITAQLIDAHTGAHLWADRFDGAFADVFELQDNVAISVAGAIEPTLEASEIRRSAGHPTIDLTAYDLYLRALPVLFAFPSKQRILEALGPLEEALMFDPRYGPALALAAIGHARLYDWGEDPETNRRRGIDRARQAVEIAGDDPGVLANAAFALAILGEDVVTQIDMLDRALELNQSFARAWFLRGALSVWAGQPDSALEQVATSLRLSPLGRIGNHLWVIGIAQFFCRRFDEAATKLLASIQQTPAWPWPYRGLAACYAHMDRLDDARAIVDRLRMLTPEILPHYLPFRDANHKELLLSGLRRAAGDAA